MTLTVLDKDIIVQGSSNADIKIITSLNGDFRKIKATSTSTKDINFNLQIAYKRTIDGKEIVKDISSIFKPRTCTPSMLVGNWTIQEYLIDSSNPNGYVMANYSATMTVSATVNLQRCNANGNPAAGELFITSSPGNYKSDFCWYLSDCKMYFSGYLFDFTTDKSVFTSSNSVNTSVHHTVFTKL